MNHHPGEPIGLVIRDLAADVSDIETRQHELDRGDVSELRALTQRLRMVLTDLETADAA